MGADGGVCWLKMNDEPRFVELTRPFGFLTFNEYHESNRKWVDTHGEEGYFYATYGTDQTYCLKLLVDFVESIEYLMNDPEATYHYLREVPDLSFYEFYLHWLTSCDYGYFGGWDLVVMAERFRFTFGFEGEKEPTPDSVYSMKLGEWASEVRKTFQGTVHSVETWT